MLHEKSTYLVYLPSTVLQDKGSFEVAKIKQYKYCTLVLQLQACKDCLIISNQESQNTVQLFKYFTTKLDLWNIFIF